MVTKSWLATGIVLALSLVGTATADVIWTNADTNDNLWRTPGNWDRNRIPDPCGEGENVLINDPCLEGPLIDEGTVANAMRLQGPGYENPPGGDITITGGSLTFNRYWRLGFGAGVGTVHMSDGTVHNKCNYPIRMNNGSTFNLSGGVVNSGFYIPNDQLSGTATATLNMTGGTIDATVPADSRGIWIGAHDTGPGLVNLHGGSIITHTFQIVDGLMDITEGTLTIDNDVTSTIESYVNNALIIAYGGAGVVLYSYDNANNVTVVWAVASSPSAYIPDPVTAERGVCPDVVLQWHAGDYAAWHDVYFGTDANDVNDATTDNQLGVYMGQQPMADVNYDSSGLLDWDTAYYWRIDEVNDACEPYLWKGRVWNFTTEDGKAHDPSPSDSDWRIPVDANLTWEPSCLANLHDVYLGTDFDDVNDATTATPGTYRGRHTASTYDPPDLACDTTQYWRIDEVGASTFVKGEVWSFTTVNSGETLLMCDISAAQGAVKEGWSLLTKYEDYPEIGAGSYTSQDGALTWRDMNSPDGTPTGIDITLDVGASGAMEGRTYTGGLLGRDFFIANDQGGSPDGDFIIKLGDLLPGTYRLTSFHNNTWYAIKPGPIGEVEISGGVTYSEILTPLPIEQSREVYDLPICQVQVEFDATGAEDAVIRYKPVDGVVLLNGFILDYFAPDTRYAHWPAPRDGANNVQPDISLTWYPGIFSAQHDVYFGTSFDDVNDADTTTAVIYKGRQDTNTYNPGMLELDFSYYWRVDEVNAVPTELWQGNVWRFKIANHIILDDFESYHEDLDDLYWFYGGNWLDGIDNGTGSTLYLGLSGQGEPVHGGGQSLYYNYFNSFGYSEAERVINTGERDWTFGALKMLTVFFYGDPGNDAGTTEQMYCGIEDASSNYAEVQYGDEQGEDMSDVQVAEWHEWNIAISGFTGTTPGDVRSLFIGFGERGSSTSGGSGTLYFDDICLYLPKCVPDKLKPEYDFSGNCIVDIADVAIMADAWLAADACLPVTAPTDTPVGWWKLDGNANDSAGTAHGTAEGTFQWITGHIDTGAIEFTGDGGRVLVPNAAQLNPTTAVTAMAWVNYAQAPGYSARIVAKGADQGDRETFALQLAGDHAGWFVRDVNTELHGTDSDEEIVQGEWVHAAGSYDGDKVRCYTNGRLGGEDTVGSFNLLVDANGVGIGNRADALDRALIGAIDDVRVYDVALSNENITYITTQGTGYLPLESPANIYDAEPAGSKAVNFKDLAELMTAWLEQELWPQ